MKVHKRYFFKDEKVPTISYKFKPKGKQKCQNVKDAEQKYTG